jgi:hypothetical protein
LIIVRRHLSNGFTMSRTSRGLLAILDLFLARDPSKKWPPHQRTTWDLRYDNTSLNNLIRLGHPVSELRQLGCPDNRNPHKLGRFCYFASGLEVESEQDKIVGYTFRIQEPELGHPPFQPAELFIGSSSLPRTRLTARTTPEEMVRMLGEPTEKDEDEEEVVLMYRTRNWSLDIEFDRQKGLTHFVQLLEGDL